MTVLCDFAILESLSRGHSDPNATNERFRSVVERMREIIDGSLRDDFEHLRSTRSHLMDGCHVDEKHARLLMNPFP